MTSLPFPERPTLLRLAASGTLLTMLAGISVGLMHDWLSWNVARWTLGDRAIAHGIPAHDIEGGFEWDGWYAPRPLRQQMPRPRHGLELALSAVLFEPISGRYAISFSPLPEFPQVVSVDHEAYRLWLKPGAQNLLLLYWPPSEPRSVGPTS